MGAFVVWWLRLIPRWPKWIGLCVESLCRFYGMHPGKKGLISVLRLLPLLADFLFSAMEWAHYFLPCNGCVSRTACCLSASRHASLRVLRLALSWGKEEESVVMTQGKGRHGQMGKSQYSASPSLWTVTNLIVSTAQGHSKKRHCFPFPWSALSCAPDGERGPPDIIWWAI